MPSIKQIEAVLRLDGPARIAHFMKRVADEERAWGLWRDGWALMVDDAGSKLFPVWPGREYAELCAIDDWAGYSAAHIDLEDLLADWSMKLKQQDVRPAVFPTPGGRGVVVEVDTFNNLLSRELEHY